MLSPGFSFPAAERRATNNNSSAQSAGTDMPRFAIIQLQDLCKKQTKWFLLKNYKIYQPNKSYCELCSDISMEHFDLTF